MELGHLVDHFEGVAAKVLSAVETVGAKSNQHELNGSRPLQGLYGHPTEKLYLPTHFMWVSDETDEPVVEDGTLTFYDARANIPNRSEYRLYYPASVEAMKRAQPGDVVFIARQRSGDTLFIVAPGTSSVAAQLDWMFGTNALESPEFSVRTGLSRDQGELGLPALYLLDMLGLSAEPEDDSWLDLLIEEFGSGFPTTAKFSAFARRTLVDVRPHDEPDAALMAWLEREELLFRTLERYLVTDTLNGLYSDGLVDVDRFVEESLRIHNRRKSRAGKSLENHMIALFNACGVRHSFNRPTENDVRPDFVFPSIDDYHDQGFPPADLTVLGAKTTCKDRWRQVLSEAARVDEKHLLTLESPISTKQTSEMRTQNLQLVVPRALHSAYKEEQQTWLMDVEGFIELLRTKESRTAPSTLL